MSASKIEYMNPLRLYDYVYYCIAIFFDRVFDYSESREESGIVFVSFFQFLNIVFLSVLFPNVSLSKKPNAVLFILPWLVIIGLNFIRYKRIVKLEKLIARWDNQKRSIKSVKMILVIIYCFLSICVVGL